MILRPRQEQFVDRAVAALAKHTNTLGVAPTGAGKTVMLSAVTRRVLDGKTNGTALILQHRDELVSQNARTYHAIDPRRAIGFIDADTKQFGRDVTFAMVQTLARSGNIEALRPPSILVVDEAHHAVATTYGRIIEHVRSIAPTCALFGVTATPGRGDRKSLKRVFSNVCDQITLGELIAVGNLVRPRTYVIDLGVRGELAQVKMTGGEFDMDEVAAIMDKKPITEAIIAHWREKTSDRKTVIFCSTVAHARHVAESFVAAGIKAAVVHGEMADGERKSTLDGLARGDIQVVCNVAVLTEGWDCPPVSCVALLRPSSYKATMIQMIGRGLRPVDPEKFPGIIKTDCVVLDFGTSCLQHGTLEQDIDLDGDQEPVATGEAPTKVCESCGTTIPAGCRTCPVCGASCVSADATDPVPLHDFVMRELDLLKASPFRWEDLFGAGQVMIASGFEAWGAVIAYGGRHVAIGGHQSEGEDGRKRTTTRLLSVGDRLIALAQADDFMRAHADREMARKSRSWLKARPSERQIEILGLNAHNAPLDLTRYRAACFITWKWNERAIRAHVEKTIQQQSMAA
jgi:DNA repair protein RadD